VVRCLEERPIFEEKRPDHFAACWEVVRADGH